MQFNEAFQELLKAMEDDYLHDVILKDINHAFDSLIEKAKMSLQELTQLSKSSKAKERLEYDLSQCFSAMKAFHVIYTNTNGNVNGNTNGNTTGNTNGEESSQRCCRLGFDPLICVQIVFLYDAACQVQPPGPSMLKECILSTLSSLLTHGLVLPSTSISRFDNNNNSEDEAIQSIMQFVQSISSERTLTCLGDLVQWQNENSKNNIISLQKAIESSFSNQVHAQKEYLYIMLSSAPTLHTNNANANDNASAQQHAKKQSKLKQASKKQQPPISGLQRLVNQIQNLFPSYGEGYIEAALACYNHDLERTTSALLEVQTDPNSKTIHPRLRALDQRLPGRRKESKGRYAAEDEDDQGREAQKARMREMEVAQDNEAFLLEAALGDYNDDYDDQYDGVGVGGGEDGVGGADGGLYDMDYETVKAYNKVARGAESDRKFWEENRNTNRRAPKGDGSTKQGGKKGSGGGDGAGVKGSAGGAGGEGSGDDESGSNNSNAIETKYRGPEKGKGGRIIGPDGRYLPNPKSRQQGGGGNSSQNQPATTSNDKNKNATSSSANKKKDNANGGGGGGEEKKKDASAEMTKIQKRRKNDNKAKLGNHNRKDRAKKKTAM